MRALPVVVAMLLLAARANAADTDPGRYDAPVERRERLTAATSGLTFEAPMDAGAIGGLGGVPLTMGGERTSARALGLGTVGAVGPHVAFDVNLGAFYGAVGYDASLLLGRGSLQHGSLTAGITRSFADNAVAPFAGASLRIWSLEVTNADGPGTWTSGLRVSPAIELGARLTPWVVASRRAPTPSLLGLVLHASVPVATEGGWTMSASIGALFGAL